MPCSPPSPPALSCPTSSPSRTRPWEEGIMLIYKKRLTLLFPMSPFLPTPVLASYPLFDSTTYIVPTNVPSFPLFTYVPYTFLRTDYSDFSSYTNVLHFTFSHYHLPVTSVIFLTHCSAQTQTRIGLLEEIPRSGVQIPCLS